MSDIYIRGVPDESKRSIAALAGSLGVSMNTLLVWVIEEAAYPYDELRQSLEMRAEEVTSKPQVYTRVPAPDSPTQPFPKSHKGARKQLPLVLKGVDVDA